MLFMRNGTSVLELRLKDDKTNLCYFSLASALKLDYYYQFCDSAKVGNVQNDVAFVVNVLMLEQNLKLMLDEKD